MAKNLTANLRLKPGRKVSLQDLDPDETFGYNRKKAKAVTARNIDRLYELQYLLAAEAKQSLLVVLQGMDAGGKDGTIRHVMRGMNPQGCRVTSFKAPSTLELDHDFLWRIHQAAPRRGEIAIFNRSHYEDVLVARVRSLVPKKVWMRRYRQIDDFERLLSENGTTIVKFFLNISKQEQKKRLEQRLADARKNWKFSPADLEERKLWQDYQKAYQDALTRCNTAYAPWFVVPANKKWFRDFAVSEVLVRTLEGLRMQYPKPEIDLSQFVVE